MMRMRKIRRTKRGTRFLPIGLLAGPASQIFVEVLKYWKVALFAILIGIIYYQNNVSFEVLRVVGLRTIPGIVQEKDKEIDTLTQQMQECELSREELKGAITATNAQIDKWAKLSATLQNNHNELTAQLIDLSKQNTNAVDIILSGPVPQTCEGAMKLLREAAQNGELKWAK